MDAREKYFGLRLEHTVQFTQQATRLIYLANGAILAAFYFMIGKVAAPISGYAQAGLIGVLAAMNFLHAVFLLRQAQWYKRIDDAYASAVGVLPWKRDLVGLLFGSHQLWALMHLMLCGVLAAVAYYIFSHPI